MLARAKEKKNVRRSRLDLIQLTAFPMSSVNHGRPTTCFLTVDRHITLLPVVNISQHHPIGLLAPQIMYNLGEEMVMLSNYRRAQGVNFRYP